MATATSPKELLVALAKQLAREACTSRASRATIATLCSLLPGLKYYSLGVLSPGSTTSIVASSSCARAGPATMSLYTLKSSALGMVASKGQGMQASLDGAAGAILASLSDVAQMLQDSPACRFAVCLPIAPAPGTQGSTGGLLLGFSSMPDLNRQRVAVLSCLCHLLSAHMEDTAEEISCIVERMIGAHKGCACCVDYCSEPAIPESAYGSSCRDDSLGGGDRGASGQASLVLARIEEHPDEDAASLSFEPSSPTSSPTYSKGCQQQHEHEQSWETQTQCKPHSQTQSQPEYQQVSRNRSKTSYLEWKWLARVESELHGIIPNGGHPKIETSKAPFEKVPAHARNTSTATATSSRLLSPPPQTAFRFDKGLVLSLAPQDLQYKNPVWLSYSRNDLESEFGRWYQRRLAPIDFLYTILTMMALVLLLIFHPQALQAGAVPAEFSFMTVIPLLIPFTLAAMSSGTYFRHRELIVVAARLYLVSLLAFLPASSWADVTRSQSMGWWISIWVEVLLTPAVGLQLRLSRHIPFQLALLALLAVRGHTLCGILIAKAGREGAKWVCPAVVTSATLGYVLPTVALYRSEAKARRTFAQELTAVACA